MTDAPQIIDDCFLHDKDRLRHEEALSLLKDRLSSIVETRRLSAAKCLGRVLASNVYAPHNVPLHSNSAVDGYAFCHEDLQAGSLPVSGTITAGDLSPAPLVRGTAVRIFTGAPMPEGADSVAMQEDCKQTDETVQLPAGLKAGANRRLSGEDLKHGDQVLAQGKILKAADLAALASIGLSQIDVYKKLKTALFSSGNEMRPASQNKTALQPGEVYDANQPLIGALANKLPVKVRFKGIIRDSFEETLSSLKNASGKHDVIITTGGASKGNEDHMLAALNHLGKRHLWQLAVKPGRPMMFGQIKRNNDQPDCLFFGLPGNPVAAMVCFLLYVQPALKCLAGADWNTPHRFQVPSGFSVKNKKPDRREFMRGKLTTDQNGQTVVKKYGRDGSGLISSLRESDGLIEIPEDVTQISEGDLLSFIPFSGF